MVILFCRIWVKFFKYLLHDNNQEYSEEEQLCVGNNLIIDPCMSELNLIPLLTNMYIINFDKSLFQRAPTEVVHVDYGRIHI